MVYTLNGLSSLPEVLKSLEKEYKTTSELNRGEIEDRVFIALVGPSAGVCCGPPRVLTRVADRC